MDFAPLADESKKATKAPLTPKVPPSPQVGLAEVAFKSPHEGPSPYVLEPYSPSVSHTLREEDSSSAFEGILASKGVVESI